MSGIGQGVDPYGAPRTLHTDRFGDLRATDGVAPDPLLDAVLALAEEVRLLRRGMVEAGTCRDPRRPRRKG